MARLLSCLVMVLMTMQGAVPSSAERLCTCKRGVWRHVDGLLKHASVGRAGMWGVNSGDNIFYRVGSYDDETNTGDSWVQLDGALKQVDVGRDVVWGVNSDDGIFYRQGITAGTPVGTGWVLVEGLLKHVSVSQKGHVWGVNAGDDIYHRIGASNCNVRGNSWLQIGGLLKQISVGSGGVWGVNSGDNIFYRRGTFGDPDSDTDGDGWTHVSGKLKYISSSDMIYGVNSGDAIFYRQGVSAGTPTGTGWQIIPGALKQVESLSLAVWGVNAADNIFVKENDD
ncbi:lectin L6-like [Asterias rubens]|uniref:lectin L6-like n=1 Tax=Asterias rubens TaxID=7604 RepID=UPI001455AF53|nr:lectin L6-like [Asterias rubens]